VEAPRAADNNGADGRIGNLRQDKQIAEGADTRTVRIKDGSAQNLA
jgi:hypothetical protein